MGNLEMKCSKRLTGFAPLPLSALAPLNSSAVPAELEARQAAPQPASSGGNLPAGVTADQYAQLQALLSQHASTSSTMSSLQPSVSLADILSPARLRSLLTSNPEIAQRLYQYLPSESATVPHTPESLERIVSSPELRKSARSLDQALTTGALGPLAASLGLGGDETFGVEAYLKGVQRLADQDKESQGKEGGSSGAMQTD